MSGWIHLGSENDGEKGKQHRWYGAIVLGEQKIAETGWLGVTAALWAVEWY